MDRRMAEALARKAESMGNVPAADSAGWMKALEGEPYVEALYATPAGRADEFREAVIRGLRDVGRAPIDHEQRVDAVAVIMDAVEDLFAVSQRSGAVGLLDVSDELQREKAAELSARVSAVVGPAG